MVAPDSNLGTHSLRASGASDVVNAPDGTSVSERCLKRHGKWKTDIAKDGYIQDSLDKRLSVSKLLHLYVDRLRIVSPLLRDTWLLSGIEFEILFISPPILCNL